MELISKDEALDALKEAYEEAAEKIGKSDHSYVLQDFLAQMNDEDRAYIWRWITTEMLVDIIDGHIVLAPDKIEPTKFRIETEEGEDSEGLPYKVVCGMLVR